MTKHILKYLTLTITLLTLAACGGGGGGGAVSTTKSIATVKIALSGTLPAGGTIIGAVFTLTLPDNVTPELVSGAVADSAVTASGTFTGGAVTPVVYTPATASTPGTLVVVLASAATGGITEVGEVATVTLHLANNAAPGTDSFTLDQANVKVFDTLGKTVVGLNATVSGVTLQ